MVTSLFGFGNNQSSGIRLPPIQTISSSLILATMVPPQPINPNAFGPAVEVDPRVSTAFRAEPSEESDIANYVAIQRRDSLLDPDEEILTGTSRENVQTNLFTLSKMVGRLQSIARYAESGELADRFRSTLIEKYDAGILELQEAVNTAYLGDLELAFNRYQTSASTINLYERPEISLNASPIDTTQPITTPANAAIDIEITENGTTTVITADLTDLDNAGLDRNLENISQLISDTLSNAGFQTTVNVESERDADNNFTGLRQLVLFPGDNENVVFKAANNPEVDYWTAQNTNDEFFNDGLLKRFDAASGDTEQFDKIDVSPSLLNDLRDTVSSIATDSNGNVFVAGTTEGTLHNERRSTGSDVYIARHNSDGDVIWRRSIGLANTGTVNDTVTDASGAVYVAGQAVGGIDGTGTTNTAFVQKFNADGTMAWSQEVSANSGNSNALTLAFDPSGNVVVHGNADGGPSGLTVPNTNTDGISFTIDATLGTLSNLTTTGTAGYDSISASDIDALGITYLGAETDGTAYFRALNTDGSQAFEVNLGAGRVEDVSVTSNGIAVLYNDASGTAMLNHYSAAGALQWSNTIANGNSAAMTVSNGEILITGNTTSSVDGGTTTASANSQDVWSASYSSGGAQNWIRQQSSSGAESAVGIVGGTSSWLSNIGLSEGYEVNSREYDSSFRAAAQSESLVALTDLRVGDNFTITSGSTSVTYTLSETTTIAGLTNSIALDFGRNLTIDYQTFSDGQFGLEPRQNQEFTLVAGTGGKDALAILGLQAGKYEGEQLNLATGNFEVPVNKFDLKLDLNNMSLATGEEAGITDGFFISAQRSLRDAYDYFVDPAGFLEAQAAAANPIPTPQPTAYELQKLAGYEEALARLTGQIF